MNNEFNARQLRDHRHATISEMTAEIQMGQESPTQKEIHNMETQQGKLVVIRYDHPQYGTAELAWDEAKHESVWLPIEASSPTRQDSPTAYSIPEGAAESFTEWLAMTHDDLSPDEWMTLAYEEHRRRGGE